MPDYYVYIMASNTRTLYTGVTNDLQRRVQEHKSKQTSGFSSKYNITRLVYYEVSPDVLAAIEREKQIKRFRRSKKLELVAELNPDWLDLSNDCSN